MQGRDRRDPLRASVVVPALALAAAGSALIGFRLGLPWLLPVLNAAPAWALMAWMVVRGRRGVAIGMMLFWALCLGASTTVLCAADPFDTAAGSVIHGPAYLAEMRGWIATGFGCESEPSCFLPLHLAHAGAFAALALLTASAGAILMGAVLMNYMAYYVGSLAASSTSPGLVAILGWHPWAVIRVASFVALGVVLAEPLLLRLAGRPVPPRRSRWILAAGAGLIADAALKAILAARWAGLLNGYLRS